MKTNRTLKLFSFISSACAFLILTEATNAQVPAGCPTGVITTGNQTIECSTASTSGSPQTTNVAIGTYSTSSPVPSGGSSLSSTAYDGINLTITRYTTVSTSASPIGLASASTVVNNGTLSSTLNNAYGISFGVNGRSQNGGNTATNTIYGQITTTGPNADGITVSATKAGSAGNTITNAGLISTSGNASYGISIVSGSTSAAVVNTITNTGTIGTSGLNAYGIQLNSTSGVNSITNSSSGGITTSGAGSDAINVTNTKNAVTINNAGNITATGLLAAAIRVNGAANITNSGTLNSNSATAITFGGTLPTGAFNSLTINNGSSINSGIAFNKASTQETLTFGGYSNNNFVNAISGLNVINSTNSSAVVMNNSAGYELVSGKINIDATSTLAITSEVKDQTTPATAASSITKIGDGALTLSGANTYSGATNIQAGSVIAGAANTLPSTTPLTINSGASLQMNGYSQAIGSLAGAGSVALGSGTLTTGGTGASTEFSGAITGTGGVTKLGAGTFIVSGGNTYTGNTNINAGSVILTGSTTSNTSIAASANLLGSGVINGNVTNSGTITPSFNGAVTNLTVNGNYVGNNGNFVGSVYGPVSNPVSDTLTVTGNTSGSTGLTITDKGGLGNRTTGNGIPVVIVNGTSTSNAFALNQRVAAGAYEYQLLKGGASGSGNTWYLTTQTPAAIPAPTPSPAPSPTPAPTPAVVVPPQITPEVGERIEVAVYPAMPSLVQLYAQTAVDTLDQRRGDLNLVDPQVGTKKKSNDWARIIGKTGTSTPSSLNDGPKMNFNAYALQLGVDIYQSEEQGGSRSYVGPYVTIGSANANTSSQTGAISTGSINGMQAYSIGLYGTHFAANGLYVDALAQGTRYLNAGAGSVQGAQLRTQGSGFTGSIEGGGRWNVDKFLISPQAQIVYDAIGMSNATDAYGQVNFNKSEMTRGRLGLLAGHKDVIGSTPIFAYLRASYWSIFNAGTSTTMASLYGVNPITFQSQANSRWMTVDAELNARITKDTNLFLNLAVDNSLMGTYQAHSGRIGLQTRF